MGFDLSNLASGRTYSRSSPEERRHAREQKKENTARQRASKKERRPDDRNRGPSCCHATPGALAPSAKHAPSTVQLVQTPPKRYTSALAPDVWVSFTMGRPSRPSMMATLPGMSSAEPTMAAAARRGARVRASGAARRATGAEDDQPWAASGQREGAVARGRRRAGSAGGAGHVVDTLCLSNSRARGCRSDHTPLLFAALQQCIETSRVVRACRARRIALAGHPPHRPTHTTRHAGLRGPHNRLHSHHARGGGEARHAPALADAIDTEAIVCVGERWPEGRGAGRAGEEVCRLVLVA